MYRKIIILIFCLINLIDHDIYGYNNYYKIFSKEKVIIEPSLEKEIELKGAKSEENLNRTNPSISGCPSNMESELINACTVAVSWDEPTATDPSGIKSVSRTHIPGDDFPVGTTTVTYTFTNNNDEESICSFDVTVKYRFFDLPNDQIINISSGCNTAVFWGEPSDCGISVTPNISSGVSFPIGTTTVTYTAQRPGFFPDDIASITVTVNDNVDPVLTNCPTDVTLNADENCQAVLSNWNPPTVTDNCTTGLVPTADYPLDYKFPIGTTSVTYTATDEGGNTASCSFDVTVEDKTGPVFTNIPNEIRASADESCGANVNWDEILVEDNCSPTNAIIVNSDASPGERFNLGQNIVTYSAVDLEGNETIVSFNVIVEDNTAPTTSDCPSTVTVSANSSCEAEASWTAPTFSDNCDDNLQVVSSHNPGDTFILGDTEVTYTATDQAGNETICSFIVRVEDNTSPTILSQPNDLIVSAFDDACETTVSWEAILAEDNCSDQVTITSNLNSGDIFPLGETVVEFTVEDEAGNETASSFKVTVEDNTAPEVISCPQDITESAKGNCAALVNWTPPEFSDNCDTNLTITSSHDPRNQFSLGTTVVTYTATDAAGNESSCSFNVTIVDEQSPQFTTCIADIIVNANDDCEAVAEWTTPEATDNCDAEVELQSDFASGDVFPLGTTTVTYTATDAAGNTSTCIFDVIVVDNSAPVVTSCPDKVTINATTECIGIAEWDEPVFEDCSNFTVSSNFQIGDGLPIGTTMIEYSALDENGATSFCMFEVEVIDQLPPEVVSCPQDISINASESCEALVEWELPEVSDNCGEVTIRSNYESGDAFPVGITTIEYEFEDENGNISFCSFEISVVDESEIVLSNCPENITLKAENSDGTATVDWNPPSATAECAELTQNASHDPGSSFEVGTTMVTYTFSKANGENISCNFEITVEPITLDIEVSKLITPNGDGNNDTWQIEGIEAFPDNQVIIVDRWGAEIYAAKGYNNNEVVWKGENKSGELVPRGTYYYFISVRNEEDAIERKGFLEILR